jgi:hypothetical protein
MNELTHIGVRVAFVAIGLGLWFWTQRLIAAKAAALSGVGDRLHDWSAPLHAWLIAHPRPTNLVLIVTSALIDVFGIYLLASAVFGPTVQPFIAILILFAMRQSCQAICTLPIPPGSIWRDPGFPSLLVTYGTSNDFSFPVTPRSPSSAHCNSPTVRRPGSPSPARSSPRSRQSP